MAEEEKKAILRRLVEEVLSAQGDLDVADELFAPDYVGHNPADSEDVWS